MNAASMTRPLTVVLDSFAARTGTRYQIEPGASLEIARRVTELGRRSDVIAMADPDVFPKLLMPRYTTWYALFGRNRIVLAYTDTSRFARQITAANWRDIIQRSGVQVGRADPNTDHRDTHVARVSTRRTALSPTRARRGTVGRGAAAQRATT